MAVHGGCRSDARYFLKSLDRSVINFEATRRHAQSQSCSRFNLVSAFSVSDIGIYSLGTIPSLTSRTIRMAPNSVDLDDSMYTTSFGNGSVSADELRYFGRGDGISVHVTTFNCANSPHPRPPIALPILPPDLLVLGLQELAPSNIAFMNLAVIEEVYLKGLESVADTARKQYGIPFEFIKLVRVGQTALAIWSSLGGRLKKVQTAWAGCGLLGLLSNKGAAAARLTLISGRNLVDPD